MINKEIRKPEGWFQKKLGEVAKLDRQNIKPELISSGTLYIGLEHINNDGGFNDFQLVEPGELASNKFSFTKNHILYGKLRPYLKKIARPDFSGICSTDIIPILPSQEIDKDFLFYCLRQPQYIDLATTRSSGANLPRISPKELEKFPIVFPPIAQQKRIAAILDKADAVRRKRREAIRLTEELLRSTFLEMFGDPITNSKGWDLVTFADLCPEKGLIVDGPFGSTLKPNNYTDSGVRVIRNFNVNDAGFDDSHFVYISEKKFQEISRSEVKPGDLLISTKGTVGDICLMPDLSGKSVLSATGTVRIRLVNAGLLGNFAAAQMIQPNYKRYIQKIASGSNQKYLNLASIRKMKLIKPPISLQEKFIIVQKKIDRILVKRRASYAEFDNFCNALLQRAFAGHL